MTWERLAFAAGFVSFAVLFAALYMQTQDAVSSALVSGMMALTIAFFAVELRKVEKRKRAFEEEP